MKKLSHLFLLSAALSAVSHSAMAQEWPVNSVATSSALWPHAHLKDGNLGTAWSSNGHPDANHPRNGGWTGPSTQFTDFPARRDADAACMLLGGATTLGRRETSNRACSALTKWVKAFSPHPSRKSDSFRR